MRFVKYWADADSQTNKKFCDSKPSSETVIGEQESARHMQESMGNMLRILK